MECDHKNFRAYYDELHCSGCKTVFRVNPKEIERMIDNDKMEAWPVSAPIGASYNGKKEYACHMVSQDEQRACSTTATQSVDVLRGLLQEHAIRAQANIKEGNLASAMITACQMHEIEALIRKWENTGV